MSIICCGKLELLGWSCPYNVVMTHRLNIFYTLLMNLSFIQSSVPNNGNRAKINKNRAFPERLLSKKPSKTGTFQPKKHRSEWYFLYAVYQVSLIKVCTTNLKQTSRPTGHSQNWAMWFLQESIVSKMSQKGKIMLLKERSQDKQNYGTIFFKKPGVARAVLQTPLSLID